MDNELEELAKYSRKFSEAEALKSQIIRYGSTIDMIRLDINIEKDCSTKIGLYSTIGILHRAIIKKEKKVKELEKDVIDYCERENLSTSEGGHNIPIMEENK
jgi:hypothetical protein